VTFFKVFILSTLGCALFAGCQIPQTTIYESDVSQANRAFKGVNFGKVSEKVLKKAVIVDTRSRFAFDMARTPRSFHFVPEDWQLFSYKGAELEKKKISLQRRLALKGVDPLVPLVILGGTSPGRGEAYYAAAVFHALGIPEITVITNKNFKTSMLSGSKVESLPNVPYWERPLKHNFSCAGQDLAKPLSVPVPINGESGLNTKTIEGRLSSTKTTPLASGANFFAYGAALTLLQKNKKVCVQ